MVTANVNCLIKAWTLPKAIYYIGAVRIAVNTRLLIQDRLEGIGRFEFETLKRITQDHPEHEFHFLFDRPYSQEFVFNSNVIPWVINPPARHPVLWHVWFEISLPRILARIDPQVFLSPDGFLSLKADVVSLPVIHDLNFVHNPDDLAKSHSWFYNRYFPKYAFKAKRIATVSEFSKQDIAESFNIETERIDVVYNGVSERFKALTDPDRQAVRQKWTNGSPYIVYVGSIHQRKNIVRMLQAFDSFKSSDEGGYKFVLVGNKKWWSSEMEVALQGLQFRSDVIFTGRVSEDDLQGLVGAACANLYVSTFEGFGIPIIESFQAQVPVITSNVTSMPEIALDAALIVDPFSTGSIASAMTTLTKDTNLRQRLIEKGAVRAKDFSWERTSGLLWQSIEKTVG